MKIDNTKKCMRCHTQEINVKSRGLCNRCYHQLFYEKELQKYPKLYNTFPERLIKKYGQDILTDFENCTENTNITLTSIAKKYGFTKENAKQIYHQLYGKDIYINKRKQLKYSIDLQKRTTNNHPHNRIKKYGIIPKYSKNKKHTTKKGFLTEKIIWDNLISLGFKPLYPLYRKPYDLIVNNKKIEIKGMFNSVKTSSAAKGSYFVAILTKREKRIADYLICYIHKIEKPYIIPMEKIRKLKGAIIYIRDNTTKFKTTKKSNRWKVYENAWRLLK